MTPRAPPQGGLRTLKGCVAACLSLTLAILLISADVTSARRLKPYYGRYIGKFITHAHGVNGTVYAVDESTIFIKGFNYDGMGPATYFWAGDTPRVSPEGFIVPYPDEYTSIDGKKPILSAHSNRNIILRLPNGRKLKDIKWLSVWCQRFTVNFADVSIPPGLEPPRPRVLPEFKRLAHGLRSGNISVLDEKTFYIPNLHYDGAGPDAYFWVGNGSEPSPFGTKVPNEIGSLMPLRGYQGEDIEIQLPSNMTVHDIEWLAVWCVAYKHNFGHVYIPGDLEVPPALGQTKITTSSTTSLSPANAKNINCREFLDKRLQVQWEIQGDYVQITLSARLRKGQYMAFGLSGEDGRAMMLDADVVVAFWDVNINQPRAVDYSITHAAQCDGHRGVCPDVKLNGRDDVILVSGHQKNGITTITYRKPLLTQDMYDKEILRTRNQSVIAAFGPLNSRNEANAHSFMDTTRHDVRIFFADESDNTCSELAELNSAGPKPWPPRIISGVTNFTARIGPDGGKRGYTAITGEPSWGIAWYINDQLIPELYVERGRTYNFIVEGGDDRSSPAKYHPLYISDSPEGGFGQKRPEAQRKQRVFAGVAYDTEGYSFPTGDGRYCEWAHKTIDRSSESETFEQFMETLTLKCEPGEAKVLTWPVEDDTPDLVYYQCFTHNNLGWKIHVLDPGAPTPPSTLSGAAPSLHLSLLSAISTALLLLR